MQPPFIAAFALFITNDMPSVPKWKECDILSVAIGQHFTKQAILHRKTVAFVRQNLLFGISKQFGVEKDFGNEHKEGILLKKGERQVCPTWKVTVIAFIGICCIVFVCRNKLVVKV